MKQKIIVTNLRIPEDLWLQARGTASARGMSMNEYIKSLINESGKNEFFGYREKKNKKTGVFEPLWKLLKKPYIRKPMGANEDDKIIYGIEDDK